MATAERPDRSNPTLCSLRKLVLILLVALCGCIGADRPVISATDAVEAFGMAGYWKAVGQLGNQKPAYVKRLPGLPYTCLSGREPGHFDLRWLLTPLGNGAYLAQGTPTAPGAPGGGVLLGLVRVLPRHLVFYAIPEAALRAAAEVAGVPIITSAASPRIDPSADPGRVKALFGRLADGLPLGQSMLFERQPGGFVEPADLASRSMAKMEKALASKDYPSAMVTAEYLSNHGHELAGYYLASLHIRQFPDTDLATRALKEAFASGQDGVLPALASVYRGGDGSDRPTAGSPIDTDQALYWTAMAREKQLATPTATSGAESLAAKSCADRGAAPVAACVRGLLMLASEKARTDLQVQAANEQLVMNAIAQRAAQARQQNIDDKAKALDEEARALEAQRRTLQQPPTAPAVAPRSPLEGLGR